MTSKAFGLAQLGNAYADGALSNRNLIINGAMQVAQRGTSFGAAAPYYSLDRWHLWNMASSQSTDVPSGEGFVNSLQVTVTAQSSGNFATVEQRFENEKIVAGRQMTFSFWIKGSTSGTAVVRNFSQSNNVSFGHTAFSFTTAWQRVSVTFVVPALGGSASDFCAFGIDFNTNLSGGLSYSGSGVSEPTYTGTIHLTGVQIEAGDTATPFEHRSFGQELALCQRYYYRTADDGGTVNLIAAGVEGTTSAAGGVPHPVRMRTVPTITLGSGIRFFSPATSTITPALNTNRCNSTMFAAVFGITGATPGQAGSIFRGAINGYLEASAEL